MHIEVPREDLDRACKAMPIFPIPGVVLMPASAVPLHVFEPRYRALVAHCLKRDRLLGIASLKPGYEDNYLGNPPIYPEIGIGRIVTHRNLPHGRANIVVKHVGRLRMVRELETIHAFREVRGVLATDERRGDDLAIAERVRSMLSRMPVSSRITDELRRSHEESGRDLIDRLALRILDDPADCRAFLDMDTVSERANLLVERVGEVAARVAVSVADA